MQTRLQFPNFLSFNDPTSVAQCHKLTMQSLFNDLSYLGPRLLEEAQEKVFCLGTAGTMFGPQN